jgi:hypothetical protein
MSDLTYLRDSADGNGVELVVVTDGDLEAYPLTNNTVWNWFRHLSIYLWRNRET